MKKKHIWCLIFFCSVYVLCLNIAHKAYTICLQCDQINKEAILWNQKDHYDLISEQNNTMLNDKIHVFR